MPVPLIATKLCAPPMRKTLVHRARLLEALDRGLENTLTLVSAPAGYGKTSLLSAWVNQCPCAAAWVTLDESDNDLAQFLAYLVAALQKIQPEIGRSTLSLLQSPRALQTNLLLSTLINELARLQEPFVLVLDDYHLIQEPAIHQAVVFLLEHTPWQLHLVLSTRADPPLPLAKLRARSQLLEIRATELCFSSQEAWAFFSGAMGLPISDEEVQLLWDSTEGWIAGLQIAAVSLQGKGDTSPLIRSFSGSNRHILDYLMDEVFERQPDVFQAFLLDTCILDQLKGSLCDAVTLKADGQTTLELLERKNLFVIPLDDRRCWYRYHHLFSDLLLQRLQSYYPERLPLLHLRASKWYEENALPDKAIRHALAAGDFNRAARLVENTAEATFMHGQLKTFISWVERLPESAARQHPLLCVYHAEALLLSGRPMDPVLKRLEGAPEYDAILALLAAYEGDAELSKVLSTSALDHLPVESRFLRGAIHSSLGAVLLLSGEVDPAIQSFQAAAEIGRESGNLMLEVIALSRLGQLYFVKGDLHRAEDILRKALASATDPYGNYLLVASISLMVYAFLLSEWNDLEAAWNAIQKAVELSHESGGFWLVDCYVVKAFVQQARGDRGGALEAIRKARSIAAQTEANPFDDRYTAVYEAQILLGQGDLDGATRWARLYASSMNEPGAEKTTGDVHVYHLQEIEQLTLARIAMAQGQAETALQILQALVPKMEKRGRKMSLIENLVLQALALQTAGRRAEAMGALAASLSLGHSRGFIRVFVNGGQPIEMLLKTAGNQQVDPRYRMQLLEAFRSEDTIAAPGARAGGAVDPLSERELEILELIAAGLSNREIGERLFISLSTVKGHAANIFSKLPAKNRTEAVARARELKLIQ